MAHRWLVTLAMFLVTGPLNADASDRGFRIERASQRIATPRGPLVALGRSRASLDLSRDLIAVDRAGALDVVDLRTGATIATAAIAGTGIVSACRLAGDIYVKTSEDLVSIADHGAIRWVRPTTAGAIVATPDAVIAGWVDRAGHRFGIASHDSRTGRQVASVDLGSTRGWYDLVRVDVAPDGPDELLVSAAFALR